MFGKSKRNLDQIAAKHSYYLKQKQMKKDFAKGLAWVLIIAIGIVMAGYIGVNAFTVATPQLKQSQANYEEITEMQKCAESKLAQDKMIAYKEISKEVHQALKESLEKRGIEYRWDTPEGFVDLHMISETEDHIRELEEKAQWECDSEGLK